MRVGFEVPAPQARPAVGCPLVLVSDGYKHGEPVHGLGADAVVARLDAIDLGALGPAPPG